uniref:Uncharacterized protein n=1 Tax=Panagrolaimus sp. JU765 TaxID=591449 RepID=A0AC34RHI9_9BILA
MEDYTFRDETLEGIINFAMDIVKAVRSSRAERELTPKTKADFFVLLPEEELPPLLDLCGFMGCLAYANNVTLTSEKSSIPENCYSVTITPTCTVFVQIN